MLIVLLLLFGNDPLAVFLNFMDKTTADTEEIMYNSDNYKQSRQFQTELQNIRQKLNWHSRVEKTFFLSSLTHTLRPICFEKL